MYLLALAVVVLSMWMLVNVYQNEPKARPVAVRDQQHALRQRRLR